MGYTKGWLDDNRKYHVVAGDCLWNIALDYMGAGNRYPEIKSANGLSSNVIYPYGLFWKQDPKGRCKLYGHKLIIILNIDGKYGIVMDIFGWKVKKQRNSQMNKKLLNIHLMILLVDINAVLA